MTAVVFGPYCTQILTDLGADVIKVEPAERDSVRNIGLPPKTPIMGPVHLRLNRGKRSVSRDMKTEAGKRAIRHRARSTVWGLVMRWSRSYGPTLSMFTARASGL
jgi:crotonobetainyl-CoA:carnitine CoA-transferase CaiB-like acyl-CoA transferase